jgi:hypothetical protein
MICLSWNCRGLGNPQAVRDLHHLVKEKKPTLVFLMETKFFNKNCDFLRIKLGYDFMFVVDSVGRSGGLILLWKAVVNVEIQNYSRRHINAIVVNGGTEIKWKFTGFYGHPDTNKRKEAWDLLRHLSHFQPLPWLCIGDFNEILDLTGKKKKKKEKPLETAVKWWHFKMFWMIVVCLIWDIWGQDSLGIMVDLGSILHKKD